MTIIRELHIAYSLFVVRVIKINTCTNKTAQINDYRFISKLLFSVDNIANNYFFQSLFHSLRVH